MLTRYVVAIVLVLFGSVFSIPVNAQITYDGCVDFRGFPVASVSFNNLGDVAKATYAPNGAPVIYYDESVLTWIHPQTRIFFYAHECGHHVLGHLVRNIPFMAEQEADCWAINTLYADGLLDDNDVAIIQADLARFGRGDWTHLPGPMRAINLRRCLGEE